MSDSLEKIQQYVRVISSELSAKTGKPVEPHLRAIYDAVRFLPGRGAHVSVPRGMPADVPEDCDVRTYEPCEISGTHVLPFMFSTSDVLHVYCASNSDGPILTARDADTLFYVDKDVLSITQEGVTGSEVRVGDRGLFVYNGDARFFAEAGPYTVHITDGMLYSLYIRKASAEYMIIPVNGKYTCYKYTNGTIASNSSF